MRLSWNGANWLNGFRDSLKVLCDGHVFLDAYDAL